MKNGIPHATLLLTIGLCREKQQEHPLAEFEATKELKKQSASLAGGRASELHRAVFCIGRFLH